MPSVNVLFGFPSDAQGFTANPGANSTLSWVSTNSGSLQSSITGKNHTNSNSWTRTLTYQALGVPVGSIVTGVVSASMQSQCTAFTTGGSGNTVGAVTLVDGSTNVTLAAQRSVTGTDASFVPSNGTDHSGMSSPSANSVTITIPNHLVTGNSSSAVVTVLQDELAFTIQYIDPFVSQMGSFVSA